MNSLNSKMTCYFAFAVISLFSASAASLDSLQNAYLFAGDKDYNMDSTISTIYLLSKDGRTINTDEFIIGVIENFRKDMLTGIPELKIPVLEPFRAKKLITIDIQDEKAKIRGNFSDVVVNGLSKFILEDLRTDLQNLTLRFNLIIPYLKTSGKYAIDGEVVDTIPLRGNGSFSIESKNLSIAAKVSIINTDNRLQLSRDLVIDMDYDEVQVYLENFLGGEVQMKNLNDTRRDLLRKCLPLLKGELNKSLIKVINKYLRKLPITSITPASTANEYIDQILENFQNYTKKYSLDPMGLPNHTYHFIKKVMYIPVQGEAKLYNGSICGISSLHRTGDCVLELNKTTLSVSAYLGLKDLILSYKGHAKFMSFGPTIKVGGNVKEVMFYCELEQSNRKGATPILKELEIIHMSTIWIELSGLGPLTWMTKWLLTGITKLVENFVKEKMTDYVKDYLQDEFNKLSFPV